MIRRKSLWMGLMLALCIFLFIGIFAPSSGHVGAASLQAATPPSAPSSKGPGVPAIHPSLPAILTARFTIADVQTYLRTHAFIGGRLVKGATVRIATIQFMTSTQASTLMHGEGTGLPATAMVCYVKLRGPFTQTASPRPPGAGPLPTVAYGVEIFDAQTGNLLMWWTPSA